MQLAQKTSFITLSDRADGKTTFFGIDSEKTPHWPVVTVRKENYMRFAEGERRQITEISVVRDETKSSSDDA